MYVASIEGIHIEEENFDEFINKLDEAKQKILSSNKSSQYLQG
jgi:hypothetical protein